MFKSARNRLVEKKRLTKCAAAAFIECLLCNVPDNLFKPKLAPTHTGIVTEFEMPNKKRRRKSRQPKAGPLEDLLRNGEAGLYGQVCWSIADRGTEPRGVGDLNAG